MLLRPLRRAPMRLGGVGFQAGLDEARRRARATPPEVLAQLTALQTLRDGGTLSPQEFATFKRRLLEAQPSSTGSDGSAVHSASEPS
jgi:hypothetical protein